MKSLRNLLALTLVLCCGFVCISGCGGSKEEGKETSDETGKNVNPKGTPPSLERQINLDLPTVSEGKDKWRLPNTVVINIDKVGKVTIDGKEYKVEPKRVRPG